MKFNKLRLLGFKSFVEPTEFLIENGLTGVVGPNGCGKSNLVEALRWVMGENSYKNMRASGMDDVIFSGAANRPSRNTAEVSLFLDNEDRTAPSAFNDADELQVSRRIERESGSNYRINGREVRAKDVQLLFADASTGARSPSMVGQGRIGELISAKPTARRALLEEAAGISGLHSRRHEAELRLRASDQNLERLDDVVGQLEAQLDSLKRQARQANRYRNLSGEIRKTTALLFHLKWAAAKNYEAECESTLSKLTAQMGEKANVQASLAREEFEAGKKIPALRDTEASTAAALQRLQIARGQIDEEIARLESRKGELQSRLEQLSSDLEREERMIGENRQSLENLENEQQQLETESSSVGDTEEKSKEALERATEALGKSEKAFTDLTASLANERARRTQLEKTLEETTARLERLTEQQSSVEDDLKKIIKEIAGISGVSSAQDKITKAEKAVAVSDTAMLAAEGATARAREVEDQRRKPLEEAEGQLRELEAEARTIRQILNRAGQDLFPSVVEQMSVKPGYEAALGAALGEDLDVPLDTSAAIFWGKSGTQDSDPKLPGNTRSLKEFVEAPSELARRLNQVGVVEKAVGAKLALQLKAGQRLVSKEGDLWRWDGYVASAEAPTAAAQRLAHKNRLAELEKLIEEARQKKEAAETVYETAKAATEEQIEKELKAREALREHQHKLTEEREALSEAERATGQLTAKRSALEEAQTRLSGDIKETATRQEESTKALAALTDISKSEAELETLRTQVAEDRAVLAEARAASQSLSREAEARGRRLEVIKGERENWNNRLANGQKQAEILKKRSEETLSEFKKLEAAPKEFDEKRSELMNKLEKAEAERSDAADALAKAENERAEADRKAKAAVDALALARENNGRAEERLNAARERKGEVEGRIREELECQPSDARGLAEIKPDATLPEVEKVESRLERQKAERERLGGVNLRAEIEYAEIDEQRNNLVTERDDLIAAIGKLRSGIQSLNKEGRERLLEAFEQVNSEFQRLFTHLFGGGTADLQLIESDDPLDAGLEILARPPGKKPQTMTLLSGGEQALTAMALIFAVFLTNPAPICVLDEVDAPLDDHNVERFCNLMDEMAKTTDTKFVLITHNPITMARVNRLFGVTMAEQGVSQLVSVDLEEAEKLSEVI